MKQLLIMILILTVHYSSGQIVEPRVNIGFPMNKFDDANSPNYCAELLIGKNISNKINLGLGGSYLSVDLLPQNFDLTFDRDVLSLFAFCIYEIKLSEKIRVLPQLRAGYSFVQSELNHYGQGPRTTDGVYISEVLEISYELSPSFDVLIGLGFSTIFSDFETAPGLLLPTVFTARPNYINQYNLHAGCVIKL